MIFTVKYQGENALSGLVGNSVLKSEFLIKSFNLNKPGDFRYVYMFDQSNEINVNIYYSDDSSPSGEIQDWVGKMVESTLKKHTRINEVSLDYKDVKDGYEDEDLIGLRNKLAKNSSIPELNIIYLTKYSPSPEYLGITLSRDTIFIFKGGFESINENTKIMARIEESTIMHEWGHLLGVAHVEDENCIMSEAVHFYSNRKLYLSEVPIEYCAEELSQIRAMIGI